MRAHRLGPPPPVDTNTARALVRRVAREHLETHGDTREMHGDHMEDAWEMRRDRIGLQPQCVGMQPRCMGCSLSWWHAAAPVRRSARPSPPQAPPASPRVGRAAPPRTLRCRRASRAGSPERRERGAGLGAGGGTHCALLYLIRSLHLLWPPLLCSYLLRSHMSRLEARAEGVWRREAVEQLPA